MRSDQMVAAGDPGWCTGRMPDEARGESLPELIGRLRFTSSSSPAIYLNEQLAQEMFVAQLGAIAEFTRAATRNLEGQAGPAFVRVGASRESAEQVTYELDNPLTKALILHSALGGQAAAPVTAQSRPGTFAEVVGPVHAPTVAPAFAPPDQRLVALVEAAASRQSEILRGFGDTETVLVPLLFLDERGTVGSVVDRRWVRAGLAASYLTYPQVGFGIVEQVSQEVPLITLVYMRPYL
jgi:hypothetical protein